MLGNKTKLTLKIVIVDKKGKEIIIIPLTIGVVGAIVTPPLAAGWCYSGSRCRVHS